MTAATFDPLNITMTDEEYFAHPRISNSDLKLMKKSMLHWITSKNEPKKITPALEFGKAYHMKILQPELFERLYMVMPKIDGRTKEGKAEKAKFMCENEGKLFIADDDMERLIDMEKAFRAHPTAPSVLSMGTGVETEKVLFFDYDIEGRKIPCKCRQDYMNHNTRFIVDLKSINDASTPAKVIKHIFEYEYYRQGFIYTMAAKINYGVNYKFHFVFQESSAPYAIRIVRPDPDFISMGETEFQKILKSYKEYLESPGAYLGYPAGIETASPLPWMFTN